MDARGASRLQNDTTQWLAGRSRDSNYTDKTPKYIDNQMTMSHMADQTFSGHHFAQSRLQNDAKMDAQGASRFQNDTTESLAGLSLDIILPTGNN